MQGTALLIIRTVGFGIRKEERSCCSHSNLQVCQKEKGQPEERIQKHLGLLDGLQMERIGPWFVFVLTFFIMVTRICLLYYATLGSKTTDLELSVWDEMCIFVLLSWRVFSLSRFSSRLPGKRVIESGFMLLALIILVYPLLFSYSGCKRKLRSFIGELIGVHFCVDMCECPPSRAFLRHLAPFQHTHRGRMCQKARLLNLCAPTEQTTTRGKIDSLWQCCWNHCGQTDCRVTVASPLLASDRTQT